MAFNFMGGLSAMGTSIADTAGHMALEEQKSALEKQMLELSNNLIAQREHVGRVESGQIAAEAQGREQTFQSGMETQRETHQEKLSRMQIGASAANVAKEIAAQGNSLTTDDNGNTTIVNKITGKVTPVLGTDGKPLRLADPDQARFAAAAATALRDELRYAQSDLNEARKLSSDQTTDPAVKAAQDHVNDVSRSLQSLASILQSKSNLGGVIQYDVNGKRIGGNAPDDWSVKPGLLNQPFNPNQTNAW